MDFVIYPAIDIVNGKCVRLHQGNYDLEKIYNEDPISQALHFASKEPDGYMLLTLTLLGQEIQKTEEIISRIASTHHQFRFR